MYDRQPTPGKEGRVLITPLNGSAPYYATVAMADEPLEKGTALNKANLLKDATAAMYGKGSSAVPNDIFAHLGRFAQHWWWRKSLVTATRYRLATTPASDYGSYICLVYEKTIYMADEVSVDTETGELSLVNPVLYTQSDSVEGKYLQSADGGIVDDFPESSESEAVAGIVHFVDDISGVTSGAGYVGYKSTNAEICTAEAYQADVGTVDYVRSSNSEAYPHSGNDGTYQYQYLGIPLENAVTVPAFEIIRYVGTGTYGEENPTSVTFSGAPIVVIALGWLTNNETPYWSTCTGEDDYISMLPMSVVSTDYTPGRGFGNAVNSGVYGKKSEDGKTFSWYNEDYASFQLNAEGYTYFILALYDGGVGGSVTSGSTGEGDTGGTDTGGGSEDSGGDSGGTDTTVTFTVDGGAERTVESGTTWETYITSLGEGTKLYIQGSNVYYDPEAENDMLLYNPDGDPTYADDVIVAGDYYTK